MADNQASFDQIPGFAGLLLVFNSFLFGADFQEVSDFRMRTRKNAGRQFEDTPRSEHDCSDSKRWQLTINPDNPSFGVQVGCVDREGHPDRMNPLGRFNPQRFPFGKLGG